MPAFKIRHSTDLNPTSSVKIPPYFMALLAATIALALAVPCLLLARERFDRLRSWVATIGFSIVGYALISRLLPPSSARDLEGPFFFSPGVLSLFLLVTPF